MVNYYVEQLIKYIVNIMYYFWLRFFSGPSFFSFGRAARFLDVHLMRNGNSICRSLRRCQNYYTPHVTDVGCKNGIFVVSCMERRTELVIKCVMAKVNRLLLQQKGGARY